MYAKIIKPFLKEWLKGGKIWALLQAINNYRKYILWRLKLRRLAKGGRIFAFDPDRIYWVDPSSIELRTRDAREKYECAGAVMDGDWDVWGVPWDDHDHVRWLKDHFEKNIPWADTEYYKACTQYIETLEWIPPHMSSGKGLRHLVTADKAGRDDDILDTSYMTKTALDARCKDLDNLFVSIKQRGVVPQSELLGVNPDPMKRRDNIIIGIGRDGDLLFTDGKHRFAIAKMLGLKKIPVKIWQRHKKWVDFRNEIELYVTKHGSLYQPMTHIDLLDFRESHSEMRFDLIKNALPCDGGKLLDIGANWGFFCRKFENLGFECTAAEHDPEAIRFMKKLRRAERCNFEIIEGDILGYPGVLQFDVVLALSIFHHFLRTKELDEKLASFLARLDTRYMIFEPNIRGENIVSKYDVDRGGEEFVKFVIQHSSLNYYRQIGTETETGRSIYLLEKEKPRMPDADVEMY